MVYYQSIMNSNCGNCEPFTFINRMRARQCWRWRRPLCRCRAFCRPPCTSLPSLIRRPAKKGTLNGLLLHKPLKFETMLRSIHPQKLYYKQLEYVQGVLTTCSSNFRLSSLSDIMVPVSNTSRFQPPSPSNWKEMAVSFLPDGSRNPLASLGIPEKLIYFALSLGVSMPDQVSIFYSNFTWKPAVCVCGTSTRRVGGWWSWVWCLGPWPTGTSDPVTLSMEWTKNAHVYFSLTSTSIDTAEVHSSNRANWGLW